MATHVNVFTHVKVLIVLYLGSDLESLRAVFNEKEKELSVAVAKVDELTRQLEDLRRNPKDQPKNGQSIAGMELEKLKRELVVRFVNYLFSICISYEYRIFTRPTLCQQNPH